MTDNHDKKAEDDSETGQEQEQADSAEARAREGVGDPPLYTSALSEAIVALQAAGGKNRDRLLRMAADFENYKKRSKRDATEGARRAEDRVVLDFLPVIDNLERALTHSSSSIEAMLDGVKMVQKQFLTTLEKYGIKPFDSLGEAFSPELHEAVQQMPSEEPANTVCNELQKGYLRGERLVRPAMVIVSTGPAAEDAEQAEQEAAGEAPEESAPPAEKTAQEPDQESEQEAEVEPDVPEASTGEK